MVGPLQRGSGRFKRFIRKKHAYKKSRSGDIDFGGSSGPSGHPKRAHGYWNQRRSGALRTERRHDPKPTTEKGLLKEYLWYDKKEKPPHTHPASKQPFSGNVAPKTEEEKREHDDKTRQPEVLLDFSVKDEPPAETAETKKPAETEKPTPTPTPTPTPQKSTSEKTKPVNRGEADKEEDKRDVAIAWKDEDTDELSATKGEEKKEKWEGHGAGRTMVPGGVLKTVHGHGMSRKVRRAIHHAKRGQEFRSNLQLSRALGEIDPLLDDLYADMH